MYLSQLLVNTTGNPDQPRPGVEWIKNAYRVHQRLWMAFPSDERIEADPFFLGRWETPEANASGKPRRAEKGFLFRIEPDRPTRILVQSVEKPNWEYAFQNAPHLLLPGKPPEWRQFEPEFVLGERYRFRLIAQMVKRHTDATKPNSNPDGKDKPITERMIPVELPGTAADNTLKFTGWRRQLVRLAQIHGFEVNAEDPARALEPGFVRVSHAPTLRGKRTPPKEGANPVAETINAALFDGLLTCRDPELLRKAVINGVGRSKAFGCGLLSVIPLK